MEARDKHYLARVEAADAVFLLVVISSDWQPF